MDRSNIAEHYNEIKSLGVEKRKESRIIGVREVNNFVKNRLIQRYAKEKGVVLDLGCGKGGDLTKLRYMHIDQYYGCDIAEGSLEEALRRASVFKFKADFLKADFARDRIRTKRKADLIMAQFSFHYAFSDEHSLDRAVENIAQNIEEEGIFLLTLPDEKVLLRRYTREGKKKFGNALYQIDPSPSFEREGYGRGYTFYLEEAVEGCMEYLVDTSVLKEKLSLFGILPILEKDFLSFLNEEIQADQSMYKRMVKSNPSREEIQIVELYKVLVFKKNNL